MQKRLLIVAMAILGACGDDDGGNAGDAAPADGAASDARADGGSGDGGSGDGAVGDAGAGLRWFTSCGDPVCGGHRTTDVVACTDQAEGAACAQESAQCDPVNECNSYLVCARTDPKLAPGGCPISRRDEKQDIKALDARELRALHDELLRIPLATYRYKHAADERRRLGFILEDVEPSMIAESERDRVDLYAYTSMAVAALQVQADELRSLRKEVARLRRQR